MRNIPRNILTDAGFWISLLGKKGAAEADRLAGAYACEIYERLRTITVSRVLVPWPIMYEVMRTKLVKDRAAAIKFQKALQDLGCLYVHDEEYRENALNETMRYSIELGRPISLADMVVRLMIDDKALGVESLLTVDESHFSDVCKKNRVPFYPHIVQI